MMYMVKEFGKTAEVKHGKLDLEEMRKIVGGWIEPFTFGNGKYCMIGDEEAKPKRKKPNVAMSYEGKVFDTMNGTIIVVRNGKEDFESLTEEDVVHLHNAFTLPKTAVICMGALVPIVEV